ncbi:MAG: type II toxin-antitoxin system VapC family toxin [Syntrophobacteraceae bacterium]|jgi:PIN domain nuclease of toxin-antitoxin system|nr:type II toxin-antitoxin system VapC family toxin [Syntrophobacteraceae bacterium]
MSDYVTDTHSLIWYLEDSPRLGEEARQCFEACDRGESIIFVPTICLVEIIYLQEKGRIPAEMKRLLDEELTKGSAGIFLSDLSGEVVEMLSRVPRNDVPDMPDRIIAATALHLRLPLISRDRKIRVTAVHTIW